MRRGEESQGEREDLHFSLVSNFPFSYRKSSVI